MPHSRGFVQGAWWPRSTDLVTELTALLAFLTQRMGPTDHAIYDENRWTTTDLQIEIGGRTVTLQGSRDESTNTVSLIGNDFGKLDLLVVPLYANPTRAYTAVMTASSPDDASTADELLGIGPRAVEDRRLALIAQERWESEGGALCRLWQPVIAQAAAGEWDVGRS